MAAVGVLTSVETEHNLKTCHMFSATSRSSVVRALRVRVLCKVRGFQRVCFSAVPSGSSRANISALMSWAIHYCPTIIDPALICSDTLRCQSLPCTIRLLCMAENGFSKEAPFLGRIGLSWFEGGMCAVIANVHACFIHCTMHVQSQIRAPHYGFSMKTLVKRSFVVHEQMAKASSPSISSTVFL